MRVFSVTMACLFFTVPLNALETALNTSLSLQLTRKSEPANTAAGYPNIDDSYIRAEIAMQTKDSAHFTGFVMLRAQSNLPSAGSTLAAFKLQQCWMSTSLSVMEIQIGRWYEKYSPGLYFGRYLFGTKAIKGQSGTVIGHSSGDIYTTYSIANGLRLSLPLVESIKSTFAVAILPEDIYFESAYIMLMAKAMPVEVLSLSLAANLQVAEPGDQQSVHRAICTISYTLMEGLSVCMEAGNTDLANAGNNMYLMGAIGVPTGGILDLLRLEMEFNKDRLGANTNADIGCMLMLAKKWSRMTFTLAAGTDAGDLGSKKFSDIGVIFKTAAMF